MAILTVKDSKTGKVLRKVDGKTGNTIKTYNSDGSVKKDYTKSSSSSSNRLYATATNIKTGEKKYLVDGKLVDEKPKSSGGGSSKSYNPVASNKGFTGEINFTDTKTGVTTKEVIDLGTGKTIKKTSSKSNVPIAVALAKAQQTQKSSLADKLKVNSIKPSINQQFNQKQTITAEQINYLNQNAKQQEAERIKGFSFDVRGAEKVKRAFKGETLVFTALGPLVAKNDGTFRPLNQKEQKEIQPKDTITLNPFNVVTGFFGLSKDIANFINTPNKKEVLKKAGKEIVTNPGGVLEETIKGAILNPGGFVGESLGAGALTKGAGIGIKAGAKAITKPLKGLKKVNVIEKVKVDTKIKTLENQVAKLRKEGSPQFRPKQKELNLARQEKKIIESDLKDINKAIKTASKEPRTVAQATKQVRELKQVGKNFQKKNSVRKKLQQDKSKLLKEFEKERKSPTPKKKESFTTRQQVKIASDDLVVKALKDVFKDGTKFKKLKSIVKQERGQTVQAFQTPKGLKIVLKESGINKKKGVKTARPDKQYIISESGQITRLDKIKGRQPGQSPTLPQKAPSSLQKLTKKEKAKLKKQQAFEEGQRITRQATEEAKFLKSMENLREIPKPKKGMFANKKGQLQLFRTTKKAVSKQETKVKNLKVKEKQLGLSYRRFEQKFKQIKNPSKKTLQRFNQEKAKLRKTANKVKSDLRKAKLELNRLKKILGTLVTLSPAIAIGVKPAVANLTKNAQAIDQAIKKINDFDFPNPPKPKKPSGGEGSGKKGPKIPRKPRKKKTPKQTPPKPKPKPKPKTKPKTKRPTKEKTKKKLKAILDRQKGVKTAFNVEYKQAGRWKTEDVELPINRALRRGKLRASQRITQSVRLKPVGETKQKDIKKPSLQGFKVKKSGNSIVLVEVRKQAISTVTEKSELQIAKKKKAQIKKALKKANKKKTSITKKKKTSSKIKKALKKKTSSSKKKSTSNKIKKAIKKTVKKTKSTKKVKKMTKKTPKYKKSPKKAPKKKILKKKTIKKKSKKR